MYVQKKDLYIRTTYTYKLVRIMEKEIPFIAKLVQNGNSIQVSIPAYIRQFAELNKGDLVELKLIVKAGTEKEILKNTGKSHEATSLPMNAIPVGVADSFLKNNQYIYSLV